MAIEGGISNINFVSLRDEDDDDLVGITTHQDRPRTKNPEDEEVRDQLPDPTSASTRYSRNLLRVFHKIFKQQVLFVNRVGSN